MKQIKNNYILNHVKKIELLLKYLKEEEEKLEGKLNDLLCTFPKQATITTIKQDKEYKYITNELQGNLRVQKDLEKMLYTYSMVVQEALTNKVSGKGDLENERK